MGAGLTAANPRPLVAATCPRLPEPVTCCRMRPCSPVKASSLHSIRIF